MYIDIIEKLKKKIRFIKESNNEYIFRCPFCGDSIKSPHKGHFYLSKENGLYHCFKCEESGHILKLVKNFLSFKDYVNLSKKVSLYVTKTNKKQNIVLSKFKGLFLFDSYFSSFQKNIYDYFVNRCGIQNQYICNKFMNMNIQQKIFIINHTQHFLNYQVLKFTNNRQNYLLLNGENIFVLSKFNYILNVRKLNKKQYLIIKIDKEIKDYPVIISDQYFYEKNIINVVLSEGIFDTLNLYLYSDSLKKSLKINDIHIYITSLGKKQLLNSLIFFEKNFSIRYNLYMSLDKDVYEDKFFINFLSRKISDNLHLVNNVYFFINKEFKDFGEYKYFSPKLI